MVTSSSHRSGRVAIAAAVLALVAAGCASGTDSETVEISHVHGLGIISDTLYVATHHGLYAYGDGWSRRSQDRADHMGFSLVSARLMFRSGHPETGGNLGVQRSTDGGRTWEKMSDVLDSPVDFHAMAASRSSPVMAYGWSGGLFRSMGDPKRWQSVQALGLPPQVGALAVGEDGTVYASTSSGLYRSPEGGERWEQASSELVFALAAGDDVVYASNAEGGGVLRSSDDGKSWDDVSEGLDGGPIVALAASSDGKTVVAADQDAGVWRSSNGGRSWSQVPTP